MKKIFMLVSLMPMVLFASGVSSIQGGNTEGNGITNYYVYCTDGSSGIVMVNPLGGGSTDVRWTGNNSGSALNISVPEAARRLCN